MLRFGCDVTSPLALLANARLMASDRPRQNRLLGIGLRVAAATCFAFMAMLVKLGHEAGVATRGAGLLPLRLRAAALAAVDRRQPQFRRLADRAAARACLARRRSG